MFFEDAKTVSRVLDLVLTSRGKEPSQKIPMCGFPYHAAENYIARLIKAGFKAAICEQLEDPKQAKGVVKRGVVRIVTPGTIIEQTLLTDKSNNYIMAIAAETTEAHESKISGTKGTSAAGGKKAGIAVADLSTSEFFCAEVPINEILNEIVRYNPSEIVIEENGKKQTPPPLFLEACKKKNKFINYIQDFFFQYNNAYATITRHFKTHSLEGFGIEEKRAATCAAGALLFHLKETQKSNVSSIQKIKYVSNEQYMLLDETTLNNLEVMRSLHDASTKHTLLSAIDQTRTPMGGRMLKKWLMQPLLQKEAIENRLDAVDELRKKILMKEEIAEHLDKIYDIERIVSRLNLGCGNGRDVLALKNSLAWIPQIKNILQLAESSMLKELSSIEACQEVVKLCETAIAEDAPVSIREGNIIKNGFSK